MKLFFVLLIAVLPAVSFGLKCYKCDGCTKEKPPKDEQECKQALEGKFYCTKTVINGHISLGCFDIDVKIASTKEQATLPTGCLPAVTTPQLGTTTTNCFCKTNLCNTVDYNVPLNAGETKNSLVGFTFTVALSSTVYYKLSM